METREAFLNLTKKLLQHKYRYYILCRPTITDYEYDMLESKWVMDGISLGENMENYKNWVEFDEQHPLAKDAVLELESL